MRYMPSDTAKCGGNPSKKECNSCLRKTLPERPGAHYRHIAVDDDVRKIEDAITALRAALAEPGQERNFCPRCGKRNTGIHTCTPPAPLTDEVIAELWHQNGGFHHHFARAIERWLKGNP